MNLRKLLASFAGKYLVLMVCLMVPALLHGQKKTNNTPAPAPKASTPAPKSQPQVSRPTNTAPVNRATGNVFNRGNNAGNTNRNVTPGNTNRSVTTNRTTNTTTRTNPRTGTTATRTSTTTTRTNTRTGTTSTTTRTNTTVTRTGGHTYSNRQVSIGGHPAQARFRDGRVASLHTNGMDIHRGLRGDRMIERRDARGGRLVAYGHGRGFYERGYYNRGTHRYIQRTYIVGGRRYAYAYRAVYWGGRPYYRYAPAFYFHPGFYGWAYHPWPRPIVFAWGWGPAPWYGYYGYYFAPAPFYPVASLWVADYLLAENLRLSYEAQLQDGAPAPAPGPAPAAGSQQVVLTPEVKQAIADEVQAQLQAQQQAAGAPPAGASAPPPTDSDNQLPAALSPTQRTFVVGAGLSVTAADGSECQLSSGDVLYRTSDPVNNGDSVNVLVQASQKGDCNIASTATVQIADLQEMHNQFCEHVDAALQKLAAEQGKNGVPAAPDTGTVAGEVPPPTPDNGVDAQVQSAQNDADQAEKEASQQASSGGGGGN